MKNAIGLVEVKGLATAVEVADTMVKVANVNLIGIEKAKGFGWMTVKTHGDVGAIKASVEAGKAKAQDSGAYISSLVLPRPATDLYTTFFEDKNEVQTEENIKEKVSEKSEDKRPRKSNTTKTDTKKSTRSTRRRQTKTTENNNSIEKDTSIEKA